jgi:hypothetical protein
MPALTSQQLEGVLGRLSTRGQAILDYRRAAQAYTVTLSEDMAAMVGQPYRKTVPVLSVVVEAIANKLHMKELATKATTRKVLDGWLKANHWPLTERKLWEAVARDGHGYILVTPNQTPELPVRLTFREAYDGEAGATVVYDDTAGRAAMGVNVFKSGGKRRVDLYFPDRIEKYVMGAAGWGEYMDPADTAWPVDWTDLDGKPLGLAMVPFGDGCSDIDAALQLGRDLNENLLDLLATSRTQGWPQRYLKGKDQSEFLTNLNGQPLRNNVGQPIRRQLKLTPGSMMILRGDTSELGQLAGASPDPVLVETYLNLLSWVTSVPTFYFKGDWPSGVALVQAESRLNAMAEGHQAQLTGSVVAMLRLAMAVARTFHAAQVDPAADLDVTWHSPQVETEDLVRDRENATATLYEKGLMSLKEAVARLHPDWSEDQVAQEVAAIQKDKKAATPPALQVAPGGQDTAVPGQNPTTPGQPAQDPAVQDLVSRAKARAQKAR